MAVLEAKIVVSASSDDDVFETGKFVVTTITVKTSDASRPPTELFIVAPLEKGTYPLLLFCHGFLFGNNWYSNLLGHIASHGYIVVAPQFYGFIPISMAEEVRRAAQVTEWLTTGLPLVLPEKVNPDIDNLALAGHSRGGKTAFALALGRTEQKSRKKKAQSIRDVVIDVDVSQPSKFKAVIGVDPVAGSSPSDRPPPQILEYIPRCFNMSIPVAVIGTGYGNQSVGILRPPCAPDGVNHSEFFNESKPPVCYFLAKDYGHCDMLDDWYANMMSYVCKSGKGPKDLMRKSIGGIVVAVLKSYLGGSDDALNAIVHDPTTAPTTLDPVIYVKE
ncbi:chlorophyllase-1-like [Sesamum indicum]|uniref:Chlorophyllase-1-like n=1 Tax=Sesamum indicum TaxID=4182 RepID=A0A6I9TU41_SESIN|nr:chlorophyllase-1-like [Sesamum indicum]